MSANKRVAVFSGSEWTSVGSEQMGDHLVEQMPPTSTWGWDFITVPIATRTAGDIFRVLGRSTPLPTVMVVICCVFTTG